MQLLTKLAILTVVGDADGLIESSRLGLVDGTMLGPFDSNTRVGIIVGWVDGKPCGLAEGPEDCILGVYDGLANDGRIDIVKLGLIDGKRDGSIVGLVVCEWLGLVYGWIDGLAEGICGKKMTT